MLLLRRIPQPVIASVHGIATAAGCQLVAAADLAVATDDARFATSGINFGLFCATPGVPLSRNISRKRAFEMLMTGAFIDAQQALDWGLVNRVVETGTALDGARRLATTIASRGPLSNRLAKKLVDAAHDGAIDAALSMSTVAQQQIFDSSDLHEGVAAFFAKRSPEFNGR